MVDINYTILIQLANFLFLVVVLNFLLLKPVLKHMAARDSEIASQHDEAKEKADIAENMVAEFESELGQARMKANQSYLAIRQEAVEAQRQKLTAAKAEAQKLVESAKSDIAADAGRARDILKKEMEKLPGEIAAKLLGRPL